MNEKILLCSDMDRTIIPNGSQEESPEARMLLCYIASRSELTLLYASGRNKKLIQEAIALYQLPIPDFAVGDVGTTMYSIENNSWIKWNEWSDLIAKDWGGLGHDDIVEILSDIKDLRLQEKEQQNEHKVSYYTDIDMINNKFIEYIKSRLFNDSVVSTSVIYSIDENKNVGLIDILPLKATKFHAIKFIMHKLSFDNNNTVYAGDSGNDLPAVTSELQAVLVKNAREEVKTEAIEIVEKKGIRDRLYIAQGDFHGMNGNYSAGVLEGLAHYIPRIEEWLENAELRRNNNK